MKNSDFLSVPEAARAVGLSPETIQRWIREGRLAALKVGHAYRVRREDFETWRDQFVVRPKTIDVGKDLDIELGSLFQAWILELRNGTRPCSESTVTTHRAHFIKYVRLLVESQPGATLTYQYGASEKALHHALVRIPAAMFASRYNTYSAVMNFTKFLVRQGLIDNQDRERMKALRPKRLIPPKKTVLYSMEEVNRFFDAILLSESYTNYERILNAAIAGTMVFAGLRVTEVAMLDVQHLDFHNRLIHVHHTKGGQPRIVGINARLLKMLTDYIAVRPTDSGARLFLSTTKTALNRQLILGRIKRISKRSGLNVTPHGLRRTFATLNSNAGRSLNLIQLALGHRDISTTQEYLMADNRHAAQQMRDW